MPEVKEKSTISWSEDFGQIKECPTKFSSMRAWEDEADELRRQFYKAWTGREY